MSVILSNNPTALRSLVTLFPTAWTVEAEWGDECVEGSPRGGTLAHHGSRSSRPCPCLEENHRDEVVNLIGVSHLDLDTLGGVLAIQGRKPLLYGESDFFWRIAAQIDVRGPHRLPSILEEHLVSPWEYEAVTEAFQAWWAWSEANRGPRATAQEPLLNVDPWIDAACQFVTELHGRLGARLQGEGGVFWEEVAEPGRIWALNKGLLEEESFVKTWITGPRSLPLRIHVRRSEAFVNHFYARGGEVAEGVLALNTKTGAITLSWEDGKGPRPANSVMREAFGPLAGGHAGIAGSPREEQMTFKDLEKVLAVLSRGGLCPFCGEDMSCFC